MNCRCSVHQIVLPPPPPLHVPFCAVEARINTINTPSACGGPTPASYTVRSPPKGALTARRRCRRVRAIGFRVIRTALISLREVGQTGTLARPKTENGQMLR